jgi:glycosyltransferase involved in cell wall biosynthesis
MAIENSPGTPLSIGYLSPGWPPDAFANGIVSYIADMADQLRRMGHRVTIVTPGVVGSDSDTQIYNLQRVGLPRGFWRRAIDGLEYRIAPRWALHRQMRRALSTAIGRAITERDIQLFEMEETFGFASWVRRGTHIPICVRLHGPWFLNGRAEGIPEDGAFRRRVRHEGRAIAEAHAVTSSSSDVLEQTRAHYGLALEEAEVIYPPTAPVPLGERWDLRGCEPGQVLFVGRFDRHKGGDLIIEAFGRVLREVPQARLHFVGRDEGCCDAAGRRWGLEEFVRARLPGGLESGRVVLLGQQPLSALVALRLRAMVSVVCSRYENAPRALIEALALGCPTVAARVGGIPEILQDQRDGLLHRPEDPDDLAALIIALLKDPARAAELGRHAAASCEQRFYPEAIAGRMIDFYRQVLKASEPADSSLLGALSSSLGPG